MTFSFDLTLAESGDLRILKTELALEFIVFSLKSHDLFKQRIVFGSSFSLESAQLLSF